MTLFFLCLYISVYQYLSLCLSIYATLQTQFSSFLLQHINSFKSWYIFFSSDAKLWSKLVENNQKINSTKEIFLLILLLLYIYIYIYIYVYLFMSISYVFFIPTSFLVYSFSFSVEIFVFIFHIHFSMFIYIRPELLHYWNSSNFWDQILLGFVSF